jgi:uncharacterized membrane protein
MVVRMWQRALTTGGRAVGRRQLFVFSVTLAAAIGALVIGESRRLDSELAASGAHYLPEWWRLPAMCAAVLAVLVGAREITLGCFGPRRRSVLALAVASGVALLAVVAVLLGPTASSRG